MEFNDNLSVVGDDKNKWIDFIISSETETEFNFEKIQDSVFGIGVSVNKVATNQSSPVLIQICEGYTNLAGKELNVKARKKPYSE